jgi:formylglycine-generating enzyme required for sulfatase activity
MHSRLLLFCLMIFILARTNVDAASSSETALPQAGATFRDCSDCPQMTVIPAGKFLMGSSDEEVRRDIEEVPESFRKGIRYLISGQLDHMAQEQPQHLVTIDRSFALGIYPVTRSEFAAFVRETGYQASTGCILSIHNTYRRNAAANWQTPGFTQSDRDPLVCVNWHDITAYVNWLNTKIAVSKMQTTDWKVTPHYRLPSEVEWEYAARAGTQTTRWWGNAIGTNNADCKTCGSLWDIKRTAPVGSFQRNPFGLYDMLGNVFEWTNDCWNERYSGAPSNGQPWTSGDCSARVRRSGSWESEAWNLRSAARFFGNPNGADNMTGIRVAKTMM